MDKPAEAPDWTLIQSFLAVAEAGSLSGAARRLERSQPTLGRQIHALEQALGATLFERHARGLRLSDSGAELLPMAQRMHAAMNELTLAAAGRAQALEGTVRITASVFASHYLLPAILADIRRKEPLIDLVLVPDDRPGNLLFREADVAVRMFRPTQMDIVARQVATIELGIFAATSYLDRAGRPETPEDLLGHDLVGLETNELIVREMRGQGLPVSLEDFPVRCDNQATYWELVRAGCGIGFVQRRVGHRDPQVEELELGVKLPALEVWLAAHQAMRQTPRVRRVWELLAEGLHYTQL